MRSQAILGVLLLLSAAVPGTSAFSTVQRVSPLHQSEVVKFERPTWVTSQLLIGTYVIVHDDEKMNRGEACTAFYRAGASTRPGDEVVSFHCIARARKPVPRLTVTVGATPSGDGETLIEYQFAGDTVGHGVPLIATANTAGLPPCRRRHGPVASNVKPPDPWS